MTIACPAPDPALGVVLRLSSYLGCQGQALGENGFEVLTGGPIVSGLLSAAITIFVALIGYRLILGTVPTLRDGVGWAVRLGFVLALTSSWPAFQTLVYRTATDAPVEVATTLLPAVGLPLDDLDQRIQAAYEQVGRGVMAEEQPPQQPAPADSNGQSATPFTPPAVYTMPGSPITASLLALSTVGIGAAVRLAAGVLVAIGPLAVIALLFEGTAGLFGGWVRALVGAALSVFATAITSGLEVVMVESEIVRLSTAQGAGTTASVDPQGFATIVGVFALVALIAVYASFKAAGGFRMPTFGKAADVIEQSLPMARASTSPIAASSLSNQRPGRASPAARTRAGAVSDALVASVQRETAMTSGGGNSPARVSRVPPLAAARSEPAGIGRTLGQGGRRSSVRRSASAMRRDKPA